MEERDLFAQPILDVIPTGVGLDDVLAASVCRSGRSLVRKKVGDSCPRPVTMS